MAKVTAMNFADSNDPLGAFMPGPRLRLPGAIQGPLVGLTFAAKDLFDVEGHPTSGGNAALLARAAPARRHAWAVGRLLEAGASLAGKTITDELAFSLVGRNFHFGTPSNANAPGRFCGGSSCGSASAVAGGEVDFALGTDTGGSVRIPASYCGLIGLRPSHDAISCEGVLPLAGSLDAVGWLARDSDVFAAVAAALLPPDRAPFHFRRLLIAEDAFGLATEPSQQALQPWPAPLAARLSHRSTLRLGDTLGLLPALVPLMRDLQGAEAWAQHGAWIEMQQPKLGPDIAERFAYAATVTPQRIAEARHQRNDVRRKLDELLGSDGLIVLPTAPDIAPLLNSPEEALAARRLQILSLTAPAGLAGLPQISLPLARVTGCPLGLSLIGPRGSDRALVAFALGLLGSHQGG